MGGVLGLCLVLAMPGCVASRTAGRGTYYTVRQGDNLYRIGLRHGVPHEVIARANRIRDVSAVPVGTRLWIPARHRGDRVSSPPPRVRRPPSEPTPRRIHPPSTSLGEVRLAWPVRGELTSRFGRRWGRAHEGIDIAARRGAPIRAAAPGQVIFAGRLGSYGKVVVLGHRAGIRTVYAHASQIRVRKGERVARGHHIADVGTSGRSTGPHLHFEVRRNATPVDPLRYLR